MYSFGSSEADFVKEIVKVVQKVVASNVLMVDDNHFGKKRRKEFKCNGECELSDFKRNKTKTL